MEKAKVKRTIRKKLARLAFWLLLVVLWSALVGIFFLISPGKWWIVAGFLIIFFLAVWLTIIALFQSVRIGVFISFFLTVLLSLRAFRQFNWLNLILLAALCLALYLEGERR